MDNESRGILKCEQEGKKLKIFIEIKHLREEEVIIGEVVKTCNCKGFRAGDLISITEKVDGANASITCEDGEVKSFYHNNELTPINTLRGFYEYAKSRLKSMKSIG